MLHSADGCEFGKRTTSDELSMDPFGSASKVRLEIMIGALCHAQTLSMFHVHGHTGVYHTVWKTQTN